MTLHSFSWCLLTHAGLEVPLHCAPGCVDINTFLLFFTGARITEDGAVEDKTLESAKGHGYSSYDEVDIHNGDDPRSQCTQFYKRQSCQDLGIESERAHVPIYIDAESVHRDWFNDDDWYKHVDNAIAVINQAAPGLYLYRVDELHDSKVQIYGTTKKTPYTVGNILTNMFAEVFFQMTGKIRKEQVCTNCFMP